MGPLTLLLTTPALAGVWGPTETLQGLFVVSSPPEAPVVAVNSAGHALAAWDNLGTIKFSERTAGGTWTAGAKVHAGASGGPVEVAIGTDETAAVAWITYATEFTPAYLVASVRTPTATKFPAWQTVSLGTGLWYFDLAVSGDGTTWLAWGDATGIEVATLLPGGTTWGAPVLVSDALVGAAYADLAVDDLGDVVVVWEQGGEVYSSYLLAGTTTWEVPAMVSAGTGLGTWGAVVGMDAAGDASVGYSDGGAMTVASRTALGAWDPPVTVSTTGQSLYGASFAMDDAGDLLAAYTVLDPTSATGSVWATSYAPGGAWTTPVRLSARSDNSDVPTAALSNDGTVAAVGWVDDTAVIDRVSIGTPGTSGFTWARIGLQSGSYAGTVPVDAGGGVVAAAWSMQLKSNPNSAKILGKAWE